jgi:hypothetical protein
MKRSMNERGTAESAFDVIISLLLAASSSQASSNASWKFLPS